MANAIYRNTSGFRGVTRHRDKWAAQITFEGKHYNIGCYETPIDAANAYDAKAKELRGSSFILNFPDFT